MSGETKQQHTTTATNLSMKRRNLIKAILGTSVAGLSTTCLASEEVTSPPKGKFCYLRHNFEPFSACIEAKSEEAALTKFKEMYPEDQVEDYSITQFNGLSEMVVHLMKEVNELRFPEKAPKPIDPDEIV